MKSSTHPDGRLWRCFQFKAELFDNFPFADVYVGMLFLVVPCIIISMCPFLKTQSSEIYMSIKLQSSLKSELYAWFLSEFDS